MFRTITPDAFASYMAEVRRKSVLKPEQEVELGRRIQAGDEAALGELVEHNLRFVVQVANKYRGYGLAVSDLVNAGNIGLIHAARKFDPERGVRFITYAVWWIRQAIMHALAEGGGAVRLPVRQAELLSRLRQKFEAMHHALGREPTTEELGQALEMQREDVEDTLRAFRPQLSLNEPIQDESETTHLNFIESRSLPSSEETYFRASVIRAVQHLLEHLDPREIKILRARFGFEGKPQSLAAIGREIGLSRERVRQIEARARRKLRILAKEKALDDYLN
jgi:RNA polymerase primary sigma factor